MEIDNVGGLIGTLNLKPEYDSSLLLNNHLNEENDNFLNITLGSSYFDSLSFIKKFENTKKPIYLSLNVQSLMSKHEALKNLILELTNANIPIDLIALQETWSIKYPELVHIPGYQNIVHSERA